MTNQPSENRGEAAGPAGEPANRLSLHDLAKRLVAIADALGVYRLEIARRDGYTDLSLHCSTDAAAVGVGARFGIKVTESRYAAGRWMSGKLSTDSLYVYVTIAGPHKADRDPVAELAKAIDDATALVRDHDCPGNEDCPVCHGGVSIAAAEASAS